MGQCPCPGKVGDAGVDRRCTVGRSGGRVVRRSGGQEAGRVIDSFGTASYRRATPRHEHTRPKPGPQSHGSSPSSALAAPFRRPPRTPRPPSYRREATTVVRFIYKQQQSLDTSRELRMRPIRGLFRLAATGTAFGLAGCGQDVTSPANRPAGGRRPGTRSGV